VDSGKDRTVPTVTLIIALVTGTIGGYRHNAAFGKEARLAWEIHKQAAAYDVPADFLALKIFRESSYDPLAVGKRGEIGYVQIAPRGPMADICRSHGVDVRTIKCAAMVLSYEFYVCDRDERCVICYHGSGKQKVCPNDTTVFLNTLSRWRAERRYKWSK
jgi:hypothetical protein